MSFGGGKSKFPQPAPKALGVEEHRLNTNEQARPVPYLAGKTRIGLTWLDEPWDVRADQVTQSAGKSSRVTTGYNYYASWAGLIAHGPLDGIHKVYANGDLIWDGSVTRSGDSAQITVEGYGTVTIYWGTTTQEADALLLSSGHDHPPYRRQAYLVADQWYLGFNQTNLPNIEVVVSRYPSPSWMTAAAVVQEDANPIAVIADLWQSPVYGFGLPDSALDTAALDALAAQFVTEGIGISPILDRQDPERQILAELGGYFDGFATITAEGKRTVQVIRQPADPGALAEVTAADLVSEPDLEPDGWADVVPKTWIRFTDRDRDWKENALPWRDLYAHQVAGEAKAETIQRPWITRANLAQKIVAAAGRQNALPQAAGRLRVWRSTAAGIGLGGAFRLTYPDQGLADVVMRVTRLSYPSPESPEAVLEVRRDTAYLNEPYFVPPDPPAPESTPVVPEPFDQVEILEAPADLSDGKIALMPMAARPNKRTVAGRLHLQRDSNFWGLRIPYSGNTLIFGATALEYYPYPYAFGFTRGSGYIDGSQGLLINVPAPNEAAFLAAVNGAKAWAQLGSSGWRRWPENAVIWKAVKEGSNYRCYLVRAVSGSVSQLFVTNPVAVYASPTAMFTFNYDDLGAWTGFPRYGATNAEYGLTSTFDTTTGVDVTFSSVDRSLSSVGLDEQLDDKTLLFLGDEIMSVGAVQLLGVGRYRIYGIRGRYDTRQAVHPAGTRAWVVDRSKLAMVTHSRIALDAGLSMKLQPRLVRDELDLSEIEAIQYRVTGRALRPMPTLNLRAFGDGQRPRYSTGEDIALAWDATVTRNGDFWDRFNTPVTSGLPATRLEILNLAGDILRTITTAAGATSYIYPNATLLADLGGESSFRVRAWALNGQQAALFADEIKILKV